jgi:hypothetical protein
MDIAADELNPAEITSLLGVAPTAAWEKGTVLLKRDGTARRPAKSGRWSLSLEPAEGEEWEANEALDLMTARFSADPSVWQEIASRADIRLRLSVFLETANQGVSLEPKSLRWLAERNIRLDFDIYVADDSGLELSAPEPAPGRGSIH